MKPSIQQYSLEITKRLIQEEAIEFREAPVFESCPNVRQAYEVVKTVGFEWESSGQVFRLRVDVVRFVGAADFAPAIWQLADAIGDVLLLHTAPDKTSIRGSTPEEVIQAVVRSLEAPNADEGQEKSRDPGLP